MAVEKYHDRTRTDLCDYLSYVIEEKLQGLYAEGYSLTDAIQVLTKENINTWIVEWYRKQYDRAPPSWLASWRDEEEV
tara:strand:- start:247 stop:480 length:234 start_codon:yes stop_codon:yes gene_type:complete